jgi:hypothetical protein
MLQSLNGQMSTTVTITMTSLLSYKKNQEAVIQGVVSTPSNMKGIEAILDVKSDGTISLDLGEGPIYFQGTVRFAGV